MLFLNLSWIILKSKSDISETLWPNLKIFQHSEAKCTTQTNEPRFVRNPLREILMPLFKKDSVRTYDLNAMHKFLSNFNVRRQTLTMSIKSPNHNSLVRRLTDSEICFEFPWLATLLLTLNLRDNNLLHILSKYNFHLDMSKVNSFFFPFSSISFANACTNQDPVLMHRSALQVATCNLQMQVATCRMQVAVNESCK